MGMRIFYDWEFIDTGDLLIPLAIGLEREDGERYYAEVRDADLSEASEWVDEHVIAHLDSFTPVNSARTVQDAYDTYIAMTKSRHEIAEDIVEFAGDEPKFFGYIDHYDWVLLSQLYGSLTDRPGGWPWGSINLTVYADMMSINPEHDLPLETELPGFEHLPEHAHRADAGAAWTHELYKLLCDEVVNLNVRLK